MGSHSMCWLAGIVLMCGMVARGECVARAVIVGGNSFQEEGAGPGRLEGAKKDALAFEEWFRAKARCGTGGAGKAERPEVLTDTKTGKTNLLLTLSGVLSRARTEDEVVLFISMHGYRNGRLDGQPGYLIGHGGMLATNGASTGLDLKQLQSQIQNSPARRIFVFADITRIGAGENDVALVLRRQLERVGKKEVNGVVGSRSKQVSIVVGQRQDEKQGLFSKVLLKQLGTARGGGLKLEELFEGVKREILKDSNRRQEPESWGDGQAVIAKTESTQLLVASIGGFAGEGRKEEWEWQEPMGGDDSLALEDKGQEAILRYGEGIHLPGDPRKPDAAMFHRAAENFENALKAGRPRFGDREVEEADRRTLEAKQRFARGVALTYERKYAEGIVELERSIALDGNMAEPQNAMGIALLESGKTREAGESFERAIALAPEWSYPRLNLALARMSEGRAEEATQVYEEAIRRLPGKPFLHFNLGGLMQMLNRREEAMMNYRKALALFEKQLAVLDAEKQIVLDFELRKQSLEVNQAEVYNSIGVLRQSQGQAKKARQSWEKALALDRNAGPARVNLGAMLIAGSAEDQKRGVEVLSQVASQSVVRQRADELMGCAKAAAKRKEVKACIAGLGR